MNDSLLCKMSVFFLVILVLSFLSACGGGSSGGGLPAPDTPPAYILFVDQAATEGTNDGGSWTNAFTSLESALENLSGTSDTGFNEIWVAQGTYFPSAGPTSSSRTFTFQLVDDVALYGGFSGTEVRRIDRDFVNNVCILSGDIGIVADTSDNSYHVVSTAEGSLIDGFTIRDGNANGSGWPNDNGGGIFIDKNTATVANCIISNNSAPNNGGGGMYLNQTTTKISDCILYNNNARYGGGMYIYESTPTVRTSTFEDNSATSAGGGLLNKISDTIFQDITFKGNSCFNNGGAVFTESSQAYYYSCIFDANTAQWGGGVDAYIDEPTFINCLFTDNTTVGSMSGGAAMNGATGSRVFIYNSSFINNISAYVAGALLSKTADYTVHNSLFWGNRAQRTSDTLWVEQNSNFVMNNCLIENGSASSSMTITPSSIFTPSNILTTDPQYSDIADSDGIDDLFATIDDGLIPLSSSDLVDGGDSALVPLDIHDLDQDLDVSEPLPFDILGEPRLQGDSVNIGCYELVIPVAPL